jgi:hypothetical protein
MQGRVVDRMSPGKRQRHAPDPGRGCVVDGPPWSGRSWWPGIASPSARPRPDAAADGGRPRKKWLRLVPQCSRLVKPQLVKRSAAGAKLAPWPGEPRGDGRTFKHGMPGNDGLTAAGGATAAEFGQIWISQSLRQHKCGSFRVGGLGRAIWRQPGLLETVFHALRSLLCFARVLWMSG